MMSVSNVTSKPGLSLLFSDTVRLPAQPPQDIECISVTAAGPAQPGARHLQSDANPTRRLNLAISLSSGEWVVPLTTGVELAADWLDQIARALRANRERCVVILQDADGGALFAIRRSAFAYGALDERLDDAPAALTDWTERIFPLPKYRTIGYEGVARIECASLGRLARAEKKRGQVGALPHTAGATLAAPAKSYKPGEFWDQGTADYVKWEVFQPDEPEIEEALHITRPRRTLELGCGAGRNIRYFAASEQYVGIDIATNLLRRAADRVAPNTVGLVRGDVVQLPFADASFDLVFADSTVQHVEPERIEACIADILRVSARYICLIEFVDELVQQSGWFKSIHMFKHDYPALMQGRARLLQRRPTGLQIQPAHKEFFLFEKI